MSFDLFNPRFLVAMAFSAALAGLCWWGYNLVYDRGAQSVQSKWDAEKQSQAEQSAKVAADALAVTKSLQVSADNQRKASNAQITALNSALAAAVAGLSDRPSRISDSSLPTSTGNGADSTGCTGAGLAREDAEFSLGEAATAARLRIGLKACYDQYEKIKSALNGTK